MMRIAITMSVQVTVTNLRYYSSASTYEIVMTASYSIINV